MLTLMNREERLATVWALLDRVRAATGPDKTIDRDIMALTYQRGWMHIGTTENSGPGGSWVPVPDNVWIDPATGKWTTNAVDGFEVTASLDRAVALVGRLLPGHDWMVAVNGGDDSPCSARVRVSPLLSVSENEATPVLSLIAAALRAAACIEEGL